MTDDEDYRKLGDLLAALALEREERDPHAIAKCIEETTDHKVGPEEISDYLHGRRCPGPAFMLAFAEAFSLTVDERRRLAWVYTFFEFPDAGAQEIPS